MRSSKQSWRPIWVLALKIRSKSQTTELICRRASDTSTTSTSTANITIQLPMSFCQHCRTFRRNATNTGVAAFASKHQLRRRKRTTTLPRSIKVELRHLAMMTLLTSQQNTVKLSLPKRRTKMAMQQTKRQAAVVVVVAMATEPRTGQMLLATNKRKVPRREVR